MKILLINPPLTKVIDPSLPEVLLEEGDPMPPLGLMYLASYLEKNTNHQIQILDCQIEELNYEDLKERIFKINPDVVGITAMTFTLLDVIKTAQIVKKANQQIKIIVGGPHAHIYPKESIQIKEIDYVVLDEGEIPFKELLENIKQPQNLYRVKGIVFQDKDQVINTGPRKLIQDLDSIPFPARHLVLYKKYGSVLAKRFPVTTMFTSRGCPFKCLFCDRPHLGNVFRARSAKNVVDEMEECQKMGIKEIFIYDDTFGVDRQRILDICSNLKERNIEITWDIRTRVNTVDEEVLKALKEAGCQRIHYGVEAGTQKILSVLRKGITLEMAERAFKLTKKVKIQTLGYFMIGSPSETKKDILTTIRFAKKLNPDFVHFAITTPYPATDLYRLGLQNGIIPYDYWQEFSANPTEKFRPMFWEENMNKEELISLLREAYRSFYFRPTYLIKRLREISSLKEFLIKARMGIKLLKI